MERINKIIEIMGSVFEIETDNLSLDTIQKDVAEWDSLQHLNLMVEIEDFFEVSFEPEEMGEMISVSKILEILEQKLI